MIRYTCVTLAALATIAICPTVSAAADAACVKRLYHAGDTITEVPLVFGFRDSRFKQSWFLNTLQVTLTRNGKAPRYAEQAVKRVQQAYLNVVFCFWERVPAGTAMVLTVGSRRFNLLARPSSSRILTRDELEEVPVVVGLSNSQRIISYSIMPSIILDDVADPDWLVLTDARLDRNNVPEARLTATVYNPGPSDRPSQPISVTLWTSPASCYEPAPPTISYELDVLVRRDAEGLQAFSPDPPFAKDPLARKVMWDADPCGKISVSIELGQTGVLSVGFTTIRYRLRIERAVLEYLRTVNTYKRGDRQQVDISNMNDIFLWQGRISVNNASPSSLEISRNPR